MACDAARPGISNGSVTVCYRAIPKAREALHAPDARLVGVHRLSVDEVSNRLRPELAANLSVDDDASVCAVAFEGTFAAGQVDMAPVGQSGHYAVVLVSSHNLQLLASVVVDRLPSGLGRRSI